MIELSRSEELSHSNSGTIGIIAHTGRYLDQGFRLTGEDIWSTFVVPCKRCNRSGNAPSFWAQILYQVSHPDKQWLSQDEDFGVPQSAPHSK